MIYRLILILALSFLSVPLVFHYIDLPSQSKNEMDNANHEKRYVFDIGSSTLKTKGYVVNTQSNEIISTLPSHWRKVSHKSCIVNSKNQSTLTDECIQYTINSMLEIQKQYNIDCAVEKCFGFATDWARHAENISDALEAFKKYANINTLVISQDQEAEFALRSVNMSLQKNSFKKHLAKNEIIFDIGGGSFQLINSHQNKKILFLGKHGIESLSEKINKSRKDTFIPCNEVAAIYEEVKSDIRNQIMNDDNWNHIIKNYRVRVYGVSLFLRNGLRRDLRLADSILYESDLNALGNEICTHSYESVKLKFPNLAANPEYISNMQAGVILLQAIMSSLNIHSINLIDADLQDSVVVNTSFWPYSNNQLAYAH